MGKPEEYASIPTPINEEPAEELCGIEFKHGFERLNVDSIRIINVSGNDRPNDIMIKTGIAVFGL